MTVTRTIRATYGSWNTGNAGVQLTEVAKIRSDRETFQIEFSVSISGSTTAEYITRVRAMTVALLEPDQDFTLASGGTTFYQFSPYGNTAVATPGTNDENCKRSAASVEQMDRGRTDRHGVFRVVVDIERFVEVDGNFYDGIVLEQATVSIGIRGNRTMTYSAEYTGNPQADLDAYSVYSDGTYGFEARAAAFQTLLTGTWEQLGPIELDYDIASTNQGRTVGLVARAEYREVLDSVTISYGPPSAATWTTGDTGFALWGAHGIQETQDNFTCIFDVTVTAADDATMVTRVEAMLDALHEENGVLQIANGSDVYYKFDADQFTDEPAQQIRAQAELLQNDRADLTRVYRITFDVTKVASQPSRNGLRRETITVENFPEGTKVATVEIEHTPFLNNDALAMYADATYGFANRAAVLLATADAGTWELVTPITQNYNSLETFLTARASYRLLVYDQSGSGRNDSTLVDIRYVVNVVESANVRAQGTAAEPFKEVDVSFSAKVVTGTSLNTALRSTVLDYIRDTVSRTLLSAGTPIITTTNLVANPVTREVSGSVGLIVAPTSNLVRAVLRFRDEAQTGATLAPVFDGTPWSRNKYQGPGSWFRTVEIEGEFVGDAAAGLDELEQRVRDDMGPEWTLVGWQVNSTPSERTYSAQTLKTTVQVRTLVYEYGNVVSDSGQGVRSVEGNSALLPDGHGAR